MMKWLALAESADTAKPTLNQTMTTLMTMSAQDAMVQAAHLVRSDQ